MHEVYNFLNINTSSEEKVVPFISELSGLNNKPSQNLPFSFSCVSLFLQQSNGYSASLLNK